MKFRQFDLSRNLDKVGIKTLEESLRIGTELIVEMELGLVNNPYIKRDVAQFRLQSARKCGDDVKANYFVNKVCEALLIDLGEQGSNVVHWKTARNPEHRKNIGVASFKIVSDIFLFI